MKHIKAFSQSNLIKVYEQSHGKLPTPGVCFRVTFKWAACMLFGGEFNFDNLNIVSTANKHVEYRQKTLAIANKVKEEGGEFDDATFEGYVNTDGEETLAFINTWGVKIKDKNKTLYHGLCVKKRLKASLWDYLTSSGSSATFSFMGGPTNWISYLTAPDNWESETLIQTFYGRKLEDGKRKPAGHALALHGPKRYFFDANAGLFVLESSGTKGVANEIKTYVTNNYSSFSHEKFLLSRLGTS